mgnify:CR=1 FL=1
MGKKEIRENFRNEVYKRDKNTCRVCNSKKSIDELDAHPVPNVVIEKLLNKLEIPTVREVNSLLYIAE